ncbi:hypothetical protein COO60DRAFT_1175938 [Scenedesmus sp. NREL 46B-D3]|nr:hypothetical protein COO60DRAFT_1175938 [Scenedesmus sp. NREL 46B-D3]
MLHLRPLCTCHIIAGQVAACNWVLKVDLCHSSCQPLAMHQCQASTAAANSLGCTCSLEFRSHCFSMLDANLCVCCLQITTQQQSSTSQPSGVVHVSNSVRRSSSSTSSSSKAPSYKSSSIVNPVCCSVVGLCL